jgi:Ca2+-binding EF-hand superfamily protein
MNETIAGTFAQTSRDSHFLVYKGCKPAMDQATLPSPDCFYQETPNPRVKTNAANRSNFHLGDERDWGFETLNEAFYRVPTKIPPRHSSIVPGGRNCTKDELDKAYVVALTKIGVAGVKRLESSIRMKIDQRTSGGPMALRKAFKYFDSDASGDIDPDEFYAAMHAFGLEFTEDQVMALFGYYDIDRDGGLSYYEFIDKVLGDGFHGDSNAEPEYAVLMAMPQPSNKEADKMRTTIPRELVVEEEVRKVFDRYDTNKSGEIDIRELAQMVGSLGLRMSQEEINNAMFDLDLDKSGAISFSEFWQWWQRASDRTGKGRSAAPPKKSSAPPPLADQWKGSRTPNPLDSGLKALHERMSTANSKRPKSRNGQWLAGSRPASSYAATNQGRPISRNSMRSTLSMDFQHPPQLARPPKVHGYRRQIPRPHTAPVDPTANLYASYIPMVGVQSSPSGRGTQTGFRL